MNNLETIFSSDEEFVIATTAQIEEVLRSWADDVVPQFPVGKAPTFTAEHFLRLLELVASEQDE